MSSKNKTGKSSMEPEAAAVDVSAEKTGIFTPTLNMMGWQQNSLDEYLQPFVDYSRTCTRPLGDMGAAYGYVTRKLLANGARIICNDLEPAHLEQLANQVTPEERTRLTCLPGSVLDLQIEPASLDGIVAARLLQFFTPEQIRESFRLFHTWLAPGGRLCVTNTSPYRGTTPEFIEEYERKKERGEYWPGLTTTESLDKNRQKRIVVLQTGYRFDPEVMTREAELAGFRVLQCSYYSAPFLPQEFRSADGKRDAIGLMAQK